MEYAEEFQSSIGEALESINNINAKCSNITPSPIYISTMTVNCVTNLKSIDVDMIREKHNAAINPGDFLDSSIELAKKSGHFRNCIILKVINLENVKDKRHILIFVFLFLGGLQNQRQGSQDCPQHVYERLHQPHRDQRHTGSDRRDQLGV